MISLQESRVKKKKEEAVKKGGKTRNAIIMKRGHLLKSAFASKTGGHFSSS